MIELQLLFIGFLSNIVLGQFQVLEISTTPRFFTEIVTSYTISESAEFSNPYSIKKAQTLLFMFHINVNIQLFTNVLEEMNSLSFDNQTNNLKRASVVESL